MTPTGKSLLTGAFAICISAMLWGLDGIVLTPQLYNLELTLVVFILHALPFLIMNVFLYREYKLLKSFTGKDLIYLFLIALMGGALGTMAIVRALFLVEFRDLTIVVLLQKLQPVFAISLAAILLREKFKKNFILWASLAIVAGYFLTFGFNLPDLNTGSKTALAAGYSLFAAFALRARAQGARDGSARPARGYFWHCVGLVGCWRASGACGIDRGRVGDWRAGI